MPEESVAVSRHPGEMIAPKTPQRTSCGERRLREGYDAIGCDVIKCHAAPRTSFIPRVRDISVGAATCELGSANGPNTNPCLEPVCSNAGPETIAFVRCHPSPRNCNNLRNCKPEIQEW